MSDQNLQDFQTSEAGTALVGTICGKEIRLAWKLATDEIEGLELAIFRLDRPADRIPLTARGMAGETVSQTVTFDERTDVAAMAILVQEDGEWRRLLHDPKGFFLDRLLCRSIAEVNEFLRWQKRITDIDTRFFAARNTISQSKGQYPIAARSVVSFGYQAIDMGHPWKIGWAFNFCHNNEAALLEEQDAEVRSSMFCLWAHLAVWKEDVEELKRIATLVSQGSLDTGMAEQPLATYNALHAMVLLGGFMLHSGNKAIAARIFAPYDRYFTIAANGYLRDRFRELIIITNNAYMCRVGAELAAGRHPEPTMATPYKQLTVTRAWEYGSRLWDAEANKKMQEKYLRLIERLKT